MKTDYFLEKYISWVEINSIRFERKLEYETAFDSVVKIYSLKSDRNEINAILKNRYFGDFIHNSSNGIFLRMFESKTSWPKTILIYINFQNFTLTEIKKTNSSWNVWIGNDLENGKHSIQIQPTESIEFEI